MSLNIVLINIYLLGESSVYLNFRYILNIREIAQTITPTTFCPILSWLGSYYFLKNLLTVIAHIRKVLLIMIRNTTSCTIILSS